ncbi:hypothetical protein ACFWW8_31155, partial [Streptomyces sp. NPDC058701]
STAAGAAPTSDALAMFSLVTGALFHDRSYTVLRTVPKKEWAQAGGEVRRAPAVTIEYNVRIIEKIDESTNIGKRDAFLAALAYGNLRRESELTDLLNGRIRVHDGGLYVVIATSKTDQAGKGAGNWIADREASGARSAGRLCPSRGRDRDNRPGRCPHLYSRWLVVRGGNARFRRSPLSLRETVPLA